VADGRFAQESKAVGRYKQVTISKSISERETLLECMRNDRASIALSLEEVESVDRNLVDSWGIDFIGRGRSLDAYFLQSIRDEAAFNLLARARSALEVPQTGKRTVAKEDADWFFYESIAHPLLLGPVTSRRRHLILDSVCTAIALIRTMLLQGPVIDIGCHAGFVAQLISEYVDCNVTGIDPSTSAIELGKSKMRDRCKVDLINTAVPWSTDRRFDLAVAIDSMPTQSHRVGPFLHAVSDLLNDGGIALISSEYWASAETSLTRRQLKGAKFGFGYADIFGGLGDVSAEYSAEIAIVLIKGGSIELPNNLKKLAPSYWPVFSDYANDPATPDRRKTQAFARAIRFSRAKDSA
jgi:SAM-dependent methyltransferase